MITTNAVFGLLKILKFVSFDYLDYAFWSQD